VVGDTPIATIRPNTGGGIELFYVHTDHLNTPRLITDTANNLRWRWESDPFGTNLPEEDPSSLGVFKYSLRFPGQQFDGILGLHYNYSRDYDSAIGRYVESDPIGLKGGSYSTFGYVAGSPITAIDPFGLAEITDQILGVGPFDANTASNDSSSAQRQSKELGYGGRRNGPQDALRHCIWLCLMAQSIGEDQARTVGETHEKSGEKQRPPQPPEENQMDRANNAVGLQCGAEQNGMPCRDRCLRRYHYGQLFGLGGVQMPPPRRR
jgi:RHS repeat-associated protein